MGNKFVPIGIILIAIIGVFFVKPLLSNIRDLNASLSALNDQTKSARQKVEDLKEVQTKIAGSQDQINKLKLAMPAAQQIPEVLVMAEAVAQKVGLNITSMEVQPGEANGKEVGVSLTGQGTYEGLFRFSEVLEKNLRPIQIRSMSIGRTEKGDGITATVSLGVLYQGTLQQQVASVNSETEKEGQ